MKTCLSAGNLEAHVKGIQKYFEKNNPSISLHHLQTLVGGLYVDIIYIYGITMFCKGVKDVENLNRQNWLRKPLSLADVGITLKKSLQFIYMV